MAISIGTRLKRLFQNTGFILILAVVLGLIFNQGASTIRPVVTPILGVIMTFSVLSISSKAFTEFRTMLPPIALSIVLSFVVLGGAFIGLSALIIDDYEIWTGFVLIAAVPPAVAVIPYTYRLGGNTSFSLIGSVAAYLSALVITPLISISFLGVNFIEPTKLLITMTQLILAPLVLSRILRMTGIVPLLEKYRGIVVNWGFFIVVYIIIGLNRDTFLGEPLTLLRVSAIGFITSFVFTYIINYGGRFFGVSKADRISLILLGTRKNYGLAAAVSLAFFSPRVAMPTAVAMAFAILQFIWLNFTVKNMK